MLAVTVGPVVSWAWPPTGGSLAILLLLGPRFWPGIATGALLVNRTDGLPVAAAAGIALFGTELPLVIGRLFSHDQPVQR